MSTINARVTSQQQFGYVPHTAVFGDRWQLQFKGTTTGAGAAGGTTVVDTDAPASGVYFGRHWIELTTGASKGEFKRVTVDSGAGTFTLEGNGFSAQVASGVGYTLWYSPEPTIVVDSSSGATNIVDDIRDEADDFWNGFYAVPITGNRRGEIAQVTDFVSSTGTYTVGTGFSGALAAGDVVLLRKFVEVSNPQSGTTMGYNPRAGGRLNFSMGDGITGPRGGTFSFTTDVFASGTLATDTNLANKSVLDHLFHAAGYEESIGTSSAVSGASSTTTDVDVAAATWENFPIGSALQVNGEARFVTAYADGTPDTVTVQPALSVAPNASTDVNASTRYSKSTDGDVFGVTIEFEVDGIRTTATGCKGNVALSIGETNATLDWTFNVDHWTRDYEEAPYNAGGAYTSALPISSHDRLSWIGAGSVEMGGAISASLNTETVPKPVQSVNGINGRSGYQITNYNPTLTFRELLLDNVDLVAENRFRARTSADIMIVLGSQGNCIALRIPVGRIIELPNPEDLGGVQATPEVFLAQDAGTYTDPSNNVLKVPDFSISVF